jgi:fatty acid desaturase
MDTENKLPEKYFEISAGQTFFAFAFDWACIAASFAFVHFYPSIPAFFVAQIIIATRQHALFLLMHEGTHGLLCKNKTLNEFISNAFAAWPVGVSTERYRRRHWLHHRHLNTDQDPDWARKKNIASWQMPMRAFHFWKTTLPYLFGKGFIEMLYALRALGLQNRDLPLAIPYYGSIAALLTLTQAWTSFALLWLVPYFTILPFLHRYLYSAEHLALPWTHTLNSTRNVLCSAWENFFFSPHNGSFHLVHHSHPHVPWHKLKKAHAYLRLNNEYTRLAHENSSYLFSEKSVYRDLTNQDSSNSKTNAA